ncbi:MAG: hypothetical protein M3014_06815, partial [Chloroflexota bacterium]|nr:hypothetical protein [Chloroflexota bacterium]
MKSIRLAIKGEEKSGLRLPASFRQALRLSASEHKAVTGALSTLLLVLLALAGTAATTAQARTAGVTGGPAISTVIYVTDQANQPLQGAEVYRNGSACSMLGTTGQDGRLTIDASAGDQIAVRKLVFTGTTLKGSHSGWQYHVWLTNIKQQLDGSQTFDVITTPGGTQHLFVYHSQAQIGFNIVASVEYNATPANLADIAAGFRNASRYLFDVTNGQMFFEQVNLYEESQSFLSADYRFYSNAATWPTTYGLGAGLAGLPATHIDVPGTGFEGAWAQPNGYRTLIHEFGHYEIGALDEYFTYHWFDRIVTTCSLGRDSVPEESRDSIMQQQRNSTELCYTSDHNADTFQGLILRSSVWDTLALNWAGGSTWTINKPTNSANVDPGPFSLSCPASQVVITTHNAQSTICGPIMVKALKANGSPETNALITLWHLGSYINEGFTDMSGML